MTSIDSIAACKGGVPAGSKGANSVPLRAIRTVFAEATKLAIPLLFAVAFCTSPAQATASFKKVLIVVLENADFEEAIKQPFMTELARRGAVLRNYFAETHPSQPNYFALISGSTQGVDDLPKRERDGNVSLDAPHIGDRLEAKGLSWKVYAEGYPGSAGTCFLKARADRYARKHVPFLSFRDVQTDTARCNPIVAATEFDSDVQSGSLPNFSLYVPDLNNDGHDTGVAFADRWLKQKFEKLLSDRAFTSDTLFVVTFDEGRGEEPHQPSHVLAILVGNAVRAGASSPKRYNHCSLLRLIEKTFELSKVGDCTGGSIDDIWN